MLGINYYKADPATFVIASRDGVVRKQGKGLSFFYNAATTSIAAVPISVQEAPFIFGLQTRDYQSVKVQGQVSFRISEPQRAADMLNFNLARNGASYVADDPMKVGDKVIKAIQAVVLKEVQEVPLRTALLLGEKLMHELKEVLEQVDVLNSLGIEIVNAAISAITPNPETARALEAEAREAILQEADDAIYARRKSAVEQERMIKEAELQTQLSVQQKEQEIAESRLENERAILRGEAETEREQLQVAIQKELGRRDLVVLEAENSRMEADVDAYDISAKLAAYRELPVEHWRAMALSGMDADKLVALGFEALAQNAAKIGEVNFTPDLFKQLVGRGRG